MNRGKAARDGGSGGLRREPGGQGLVIARTLLVGARVEDRDLAHAADIGFQWAWEFFGRPTPPTGAGADTVDGSTPDLPRNTDTVFVS